MPKSLFSEANKSFIKILIRARQDAGLKQSELAELIGKDQSYISNIERGQRRVDMLEFYILARAMQVDPLELYASIIQHLPDRYEI